MHTHAVYIISVLLFILSGLSLFAAGSSWAKVARYRGKANDEALPQHTVRAAAGLTAAALVLLGAAILWAAALAFLLRI